MTPPRQDLRVPVRLLTTVGRLQSTLAKCRLEFQGSYLRKSQLDVGSFASIEDLCRLLEARLLEDIIRTSFHHRSELRCSAGPQVRCLQQLASPPGIRLTPASPDRPSAYISTLYSLTERLTRAEWPKLLQSSRILRHYHLVMRMIHYPSPTTRPPSPKRGPRLPL